MSSRPPLGAAKVKRRRRGDKRHRHTKPCLLKSCGRKNLPLPYDLLEVMGTRHNTELEFECSILSMLSSFSHKKWFVCSLRSTRPHCSLPSDFWENTFKLLFLDRMDLCDIAIWFWCFLLMIRLLTCFLEHATRYNPCYWSSDTFDMTEYFTHSLFAVFCCCLHWSMSHSINLSCLLVRHFSCRHSRISEELLSRLMTKDTPSVEK